MLNHDKIVQDCRNTAAPDDCRIVEGLKACCKDRRQKIIKGRIKLMCAYKALTNCAFRVNSLRESLTNDHLGEFESTLCDIEGNITKAMRFITESLPRNTEPRNDGESKDETSLLRKEMDECRSKLRKSEEERIMLNDVLHAIRDEARAALLSIRQGDERLHDPIFIDGNNSIRTAAGESSQHIFTAEIHVLHILKHPLPERPNINQESKECDALRAENDTLKRNTCAAVARVEELQELLQKERTSTKEAINALHLEISFLKKGANSRKDECNSSQYFSEKLRSLSSILSDILTDARVRSSVTIGASYVPNADIKGMIRVAKERIGEHKREIFVLATALLRLRSLVIMFGGKDPLTPSEVSYIAELCE
jgi:hypothetical protein